MNHILNHMLWIQNAMNYMLWIQNAMKIMLWIDPGATITAYFIDCDGKLKNYVFDTQAFGDVSHSGDNLSLYLNAQAAKWNFENKVDVIVTDNASNITNAVEYSNFESLKCGGHTIQ